MMILSEGVKAASRFTKNLTAAGKRLRQAITSYNQLEVPAETFPGELEQKSVLTAEEAWWMVHLKDSGTPTIRRTMVDHYHQMWRGKEEIKHCEDDFQNIKEHLRNQINACHIRLATLAVQTPKSRQTFGEMQLLMCKLIWCANFIRASAPLKSIIHEVALDLDGLTAMADSVEPALDLMFKLAMEDNDDVLFHQDLEMIDEIDD